MINIIVPLAIKHKDINTYPIYLNTYNNRMIIEHVINNYKEIDQQNNKMIFIIHKDSCIKFNFDKTLDLIRPKNSKIIVLNNYTQGAPCSVMMAIDEINFDDELLVVNSDQILNIDLSKKIKDIRENNVDGCSLIVDSAHPRWSYVKIDKNNFIYHAEEKNPISRNAIAGFYYYKRAENFFNNCMEMIENNTRYKNNFYLSHIYNEMILSGLNIYAIKISNKDLLSFHK